MKVSNKEFEAIFNIEYMNYNNPKMLSEEMGISEDDVERILRALEEKDLISIEMRDGSVYGSQLTEKGKEVWESEEFEELKNELGY